MRYKLRRLGFNYWMETDGKQFFRFCTMRYKLRRLGFNY
jgi:hypothetical protein